MGQKYVVKRLESQRWIKCPEPLELVRRRPIVVNNKRESACCIALRRGEFSVLLQDPSFSSVQTSHDVNELEVRRATWELMKKGIVGLITSTYTTREMNNALPVFPLLRALQNNHNIAAQVSPEENVEKLNTQLCRPLIGKHTRTLLSNSLQDSISQWFRPYRDYFQDITWDVLHNLPRVFWLTGDRHTEIEMPRADGIAASIRLGPTRTGAYADYDIESGVIEPVLGHRAQQAEVYNKLVHGGKQCYIVFLVLKRR